MKLGLFQILVIAFVILVFFGRGRVSGMFGDIGKGIKSFRKGLEGEDEPRVIEGVTVEAKPASEAAAVRSSAD